MHQPSAPAAITSTMHDAGGLGGLDQDRTELPELAACDRPRSPRNSAYRQATAAASVGVKMPLNMPPQDHHRRHHGEEAVAGRCGRLAAKPAKGMRAMPSRRATTATIAISDRPISSAGDDAGQEQLADRDVGRHAVDHHRQRGRDDRADGGGRRGDRCRGLRLVAGLLHRADLDRAGAGGVGHGRADHAGEDHRWSRMLAWA